MVYASSTLALAALEYLVHVDPDDVPTDLLALELRIPDRLSHTEQLTGSLPDDWRAISASACREIGDRWVTEGRSLALIVPSVIIPTEANLLLSPGHREMSLVQLMSTSAFAFDPRLLHRP